MEQAPMIPCGAGADEVEQVEAETVIALFGQHTAGPAGDVNECERPSRQRDIILLTVRWLVVPLSELQVVRSQPER